MSGWWSFFRTSRGRIVFALAAFGLLVRLAAAPSYGTQDVEWWKAWSGHVVQHGLLSVYGSADDVRIVELFRQGKTLDEVRAETQTIIPFKPHAYFRKKYKLGQPPIYIYSLSASTSLYSLVSPELENNRVFNFFLNLPPILYSALLSLLIAWFVRRRVDAALGATAGLAYWLNPLVILNAPVQGYQDPLCALFATAAVVALYEKRLIPAVVLLTAGLLAKPQGVLIAPVVLWVGLLEHPLRTNLKAWLAGLGTGLLVALPFLAGGRILSVVLGVLSIGEYSADLTRQSLNLWWPVQYFSNAAALSDKGVEIGRALLGLEKAVFRDRPIETFTNATGVPAAAIGFVLLLAFTVLNLWNLKRRLGVERRSLVTAAALQIYAYFMLRAGVQVNHYFVMIPVLTLIAFGTRAAFRHYAVVCAIFLAQDLIFYGLGRDFDLGKGLLMKTATGWVTVVLAFVNLRVFWRWSRREFSGLVSLARILPPR